MQVPLRSLSRAKAQHLPPGAAHYAAYVGPPGLYDLMGASQFRLLTALGLRENHSVLDFGCGSLRAGRLLIPYLAAGKYHGIEPNEWLVGDAIAAEIGQDQIRLKQPRFASADDFDTGVFGVRFDFILAQSILSHCGRDLVARLLGSIAHSLAEGGMALVTFVPLGAQGLEREFAGDGWVYPGCVAYRAETIQRFINAAGLCGAALPWFHPSQVWYALAHTPERLPPPAALAQLGGAVLNVPGFAPPG